MATGVNFEAGAIKSVWGRGRERCHAPAAPIDPRHNTTPTWVGLPETEGGMNVLNPSAIALLSLENPTLFNNLNFVLFLQIFFEQIPFLEGLYTELLNVCRPILISPINRDGTSLVVQVNCWEIPLVELLCHCVIGFYQTSWFPSWTVTIMFLCKSNETTGRLASENPYKCIVCNLKNGFAKRNSLLGSKNRITKIVLNNHHSIIIIVGRNENQSIFVYHKDHRASQSQPYTRQEIFTLLNCIA